MKLSCFGHSILEIIPCFRETFRIRDTSFCFREAIFPGFASATFHNTLLRCFRFRDRSAVHFLLAFNRQFQLSTLLQHFRFRKLPRKHTFRKPSASNNTPPPLLINTLLQNSSTTLFSNTSLQHCSPKCNHCACHQNTHPKGNMKCTNCCTCHTKRIPPRHLQHALWKLPSGKELTITLTTTCERLWTVAKRFGSYDEMGERSSLPPRPP